MRPVLDILTQARAALRRLPALLAGQAPRLLGFLRGDPLADRAVPPSGFTASLTLLTAGAMGFLAVFALALSLATGRLADRWGEELAQTATLRRVEGARAMSLVRRTRSATRSSPLNPSTNAQKSDILPGCSLSAG